ncbi:MAG: hypothetical protein ACLP4R_16380 [Solirubrobacteraceae bacterium]
MRDGTKVCIAFEGRDTAGKGGVIKRVIKRVTKRGQPARRTVDNYSPMEDPPRPPPNECSCHERGSAARAERDALVG